MKLSLKIKLTISYILLSLFIICSLLIASNYFLEEKFQNYIIDKQEVKNKSIVEQVANEFSENGGEARVEMLHSIGESALSQGIILMVNTTDGEELFCMSTLDSQECDNMIESMRNHMESIYPNFEGAYLQKDYDVTRNNKKLGVVTLGYYGPFYYNDEDLHFLHMLNNILLVEAFVFLILAACLGYYMAGKISKPIKKVIDKTKEIEMGDYSDRLVLDSKTKEINQLVQSVNSLAATLEWQQNLKKRMAKDYAHELRTPLATLLSNLEAMIDRIWEPNEERLESCREEVLRLTRMISEIDNLVKIEKDSLALNKEKFDLANVVGVILQNFEAELEIKKIKLDVHLSQCELLADKDKTIQVIVNLIVNAIKYTDSGGSILITVRKNQGKAMFSISDTGIGISQEDMPNIFEHLYRTDKSRNRDTGGLGIGLSIVKVIIDAHGGSIEVKSVLGKGSEFLVLLPL